MARPLRPQHRDRTLVRRRHRSWMLAMILATAGWSVWWLAVILHRWRPELAPAMSWIYLVTGALAAVGGFLAFFTIRARLIWVLLAGVPLFANASLFLLPFLFGDEVREFLEQGAG